MINICSKAAPSTAQFIAAKLARIAARSTSCSTNHNMPPVRASFTPKPVSDFNRAIAFADAAASTSWLRRSLKLDNVRSPTRSS